MMQTNSKLTSIKFLRLLPIVLIIGGLVAVPFLTGVATVSLFTKILIYALLVASLDLLVGYAGLWSFGHAAFFALGAYSTGILINAFGVTDFWISAPATLAIVAVIALIFGAISLRVSGVYFLLITLATGQLVYGMANTSSGMLGALTGGSDGLLGIPYPNIGISFTSIKYYYFTLLVVIFCMFGLYRVINSPFGYALRGIREDEIRLSALGYNVWAFKLVAFVIAGVMAGVAGLLFAHFNGFISPNMASVETAGLLWLMLIVGGTGTLWGALLGSFLVLFTQYYVSAWTPERWQLVLGIAFIVTVMAFRKGFYPWIKYYWMKGIGDDNP